MLFIFTLLLFLLGIILFSTTIILLLIAIVINLYTRVPYAPTPQELIPELIRAMGVKKGQRIYDLGCGDGRMLFALEKYGVQAVGFELSPFAYLKAIFIKYLKRSKVKIYYQNFFSADLSNADMVFCFLVKQVMPKLEKKLLAELPFGARVISYGFPFPHWKHQQILIPKTSPTKTKVYFYKKLPDENSSMKMEDRHLASSQYSN